MLNQNFEEQDFDELEEGQLPESEQETSETPTAVSQSEIESIRAEMDAREARILEELRRNRQSLKDVGDSIMERVDTRFKNESRVIDQMEQSQQIDPDSAERARTNLEKRIKSEELQNQQYYRNQQLAQQTQEWNNRLAVAQNQMAAILGQSGLQANDPEFLQLPREINADPLDAVEIYRKQVEAAAAKKAKRAVQSNRPSRPGINVDMSGGGGSTLRTQDIVVKELEDLMATTARSPEERQARKKRRDQLDAELAQYS